MWYLWLLLIWPARICLVVVHELGHAFVGKACGYKVDSIAFGAGQVKREFELFGVTVILRSLALLTWDPYQFGYERAGGFVKFASEVAFPEKFGRTRAVLVYLAGGFAELTFFVLLLMIFGLGEWVLAFLLLPFSVIMSLWPMARHGLANDGQFVKNTLKPATPDILSVLINEELKNSVVGPFPPEIQNLGFAVMLAHLHRVVEQNPESHAVLTYLGSHYTQEDQVEYAVEIVRPLKAALLDNQVSAELRGRTTNLVMYLDALQPPDSWEDTLVLAESLTDEIQYGLPHTLGAIAIRLNEYPEIGLELLERTELPPSRIEHARTAYFRALAYRQLGQSTLAKEQIRFGLSILPSFDPLLDLAIDEDQPPSDGQDRSVA